MQILPLTEVKARLSELIARITKTDESVTVMRNGRAVAVLISSEKYESLTESLAVLGDKRLMREIRRGIKSARKSGVQFSPADIE